jgi:hypothetical protein
MRGSQLRRMWSATSSFDGEDAVLVDYQDYR